MPDLSLLYELFVVFASAIVVVLVFHRLKVPHIVGFLFCGMAVGPHGLHLITRHDSIEALAEIGVVLLLFTIGLEFSLAELRRIKRDVLLGGSLQVSITAAVVVGIAAVFGMTLPRAFFLGQMLALSSTAIVLSVLAQRREVDTLQGRIILGILLFQDLCVVPMMLLTPLLGGSGEVQILAILFSLGKALLLIAVVMVLAMFVVPRVLGVIVRVRLRDVLVLGVVIICIGTAWLTSALGLSLALGAFIAGLAISESPYSHQVVAEILPFKDVFNSLFFISIGMLLNLKFFGEHFAVLLLLVAGILLIKTIAGGFAVKLLSGSTRLALIVGLSVSQIGEFSFILSKFGLQYQLLDSVLYQGFLAASVMTMIVTPFLMMLAPYLAKRLPERWDNRRSMQQSKTAGHNFTSLHDHTIIVGFGPNGRYLAHVLKESSIPYCILELNPQTVTASKAEDEPISFGDAARVENLQLVNANEARILVITATEAALNQRVIAVARQNFPGLYIIVRTKFMAAVDELYRLGADYVIAEEFESATEIFAHVLAEYDLPRHVIASYIEAIRREGAPMLRQPLLPPASLERLRQLLAGSIVENFLILEDSPVVGKTLAELDWRRRTGATIIAIVHNHQHIPNPPPEFALTAGDLLVVIGAHRDLEKVEELVAPKDERTRDEV